MSGFDTFKKQTVENIFGGIDFSTKGYIDHLVFELVRFINHHPDYCTTSSCSGRLVLFYNSQETKGVHWTYVNHGTCDVNDVELAIQQKVEENTLLIMKVEPFIMHICCRTPEAAKQLHQWSAECGFRESGITLGEKRTMLAIRTTAFLMELPVARNGQLLFPKEFLQIAVEEANEKLRLNFERIDRFMMMLKRNWQWPTLVVSSLSPASHPASSHAYLPSHHLQRYGAAAAVVTVGGSTTGASKAVPLILGGQGQVNDNRSGRDTQAMYILAKPVDIKDENTLNHHLLPASGVSHPFVHAVTVAVQGGRYLLVSGGRSAPSTAAPCLQIYRQCVPLSAEESAAPAPAVAAAPTKKKSSTPVLPSYEGAVALQQQGDIPAPRWGHVFLAISDTEYLLSGGRNETAVFDDAFLLRITWSETQDLVACTWTRLQLQPPPASTASSTTTTALQRFFAAATLIPHPHHCERRPHAPYVLLHGGLSSIDTHLARDDMILLDLTQGRLTTPLLKTDDALAHEAYAALQRFGHSLTSIGGKCILLMGGVSDASTTVTTHVLLLDYTVNHREELVITSRMVPKTHIFGREEHHDGQATAAATAAAAVARQPEAAPVWTDAQLRVHHAAVLVAAQKANVYDRVLVIGGGLLSLAFGDCYAESLTIELGFPRPVKRVDAPSSSSSSSSSSSNNTAASRSTTKTTKQQSSPSSSSSAVAASAPVSLTEGGCPMLLVSSQRTKAMKTWLETHRYLNKQVKIVSFTLTDETAGQVEMYLAPAVATPATPATPATATTTTTTPADDVEADAAANASSVWEIRPGTPVCGLPITASLLAMLTHAAVGVTDEEIHALHQSLTTLLGEPRVYFIAQYTASRLALSASATASAAQSTVRGYAPLITTTSGTAAAAVPAAVPVDAAGSLATTDAQPSTVPPTAATAATKKAPKKTKHQRAEELLRAELTAALQRWCPATAVVPDDAWANLPQKYEMVGDVLMIPERSFRHETWITLIAAMETAAAAAPTATTTVAASFVNHPFWQLIAHVWQVHRIARKATIDERPMRESKVLLLYKYEAPVATTTAPPTATEEAAATTTTTTAATKKPKRTTCVCGEPRHTDTIPGWVTVLENKIAFSFDLTKVMFCSGNNTERMRFGRLPSQGDVVVDFYAGIGYFTVPLLVAGGVKHVYALEWNPHSIFALKHNLAANGVSPDRYTILFGDNRLTSVEHRIVDLADRISLGLLPTSTDGWPLAARALKPTGGVVHIHENVHQRDVEDWQAQTCRTFERLFAEIHKPMAVTVIHRECVKSYAPRVHHYVLDVRCTPITSVEPQPLAVDQVAR